MEKVEGELPRDKQPWDKSGFIVGGGVDYLISESSQYLETLPPLQSYSEIGTPIFTILFFVKN